jgi:hypothetical protein
MDNAHCPPTLHPLSALFRFIFSVCCKLYILNPSLLSPERPSSIFLYFGAVRSATRNTPRCVVFFAKRSALLTAVKSNEILLFLKACSPCLLTRYLPRAPATGVKKAFGQPTSVVSVLAMRRFMDVFGTPFVPYVMRVGDCFVALICQKMLCFVLIIGMSRSVMLNK